MIHRNDTIGFQILPEGTGLRIRAYSEEGERVGSAMMETGYPSHFREGHGYFIGAGILKEEGLVAVVSSIEVPASLEGNGIGRALLEHAVELAGQQDCEAIYVHASDIGRGDPQGFYLACDFEKVSPESTYLRKRISVADRINHAFGKSLGLLNETLVGTARRWLNLCPA